MEPSGEVAAGSLISLRVEKESHDEGPVVASLISPRVEKDVTRAPEEYISRKVWDLRNGRLGHCSQTNSHWGSFDMVMDTRRRLDF